MSTSTKHLPDDTMITQMAQIFQIMGDESRLKILRSLMGGPLTVNEIVASTGQSQANVSKHLSLLTRSGMLARRKQGTRVWYSIKDPMVIALCDAVCQNRPIAIDTPKTNSIETFKPNQLLKVETQMIIRQEPLTFLRDQGVSSLLSEPNRELLADGFVFTEGPLELADGSLVFQDLKSDKTWKWSEANGLQLFREKTNAANGQTWGPDGRIWICEQNGRRLSSTKPDGSDLKTELELWEGARLNSPNDIITRRDGLILFTDPPYGVEPENRQLHFQGVYAYRPGWANPKLLLDDFERPNGLALSPDESTLYICDTFRYHLRAFEITSSGEIKSGSSRIFAKFDTDGPGGPDGMKIDTDGRVYVAVLGGIWVYEPTGQFLGIIATPKRPSNLAWCGPNGSRLCVTAVDQVFRFHLNVQGVMPWKSS